MDTTFFVYTADIKRGQLRWVIETTKDKTLSRYVGLHARPAFAEWDSVRKNSLFVTTPSEWKDTMIGKSHPGAWTEIRCLGKLRKIINERARSSAG